MKFRKGFVSNSSSTSFIIGSKDQISSDSVARLLGAESSPARRLLKDLAVWIAMNAKPIRDVDKWLKDNFDEAPSESFVRLRDKFPFLYEVRASNEDCDGWGEMFYSQFGESGETLIASDGFEMSCKYGR
jgi:hypothetical protein